MTEQPPLDDRDLAAIKLIGRTGAKEFTIRFCAEAEPIVWMALADYPDGKHAVAAALTPSSAIMHLCDELVDGGSCMHCNRPTGFTPDLGTMPMDDFFCWYQWDPELKTFRRGCE